MQITLLNTTELFRIVYLFDILAAVVFAVSGALVASRKNLDVMGFMWFSVITGAGEALRRIQQENSGSPGDYYQRLTRNNGGAQATSTGAVVPCAGHEPLRGRTGDRQLRWVGCDRRLGREGLRAGAHRCVGTSGHDVLSGTDAPAVRVSLLCPLRGIRQSGRRANFVCATSADAR